MFLFMFLLFNLFLLSGCKLVEFVKENQVDYTDEILTLKAERANLLTEKKKLTDMVNSIIEKTKTGEVTINDAQLMFAEINKTRDNVSESINKINSKISDMKTEAKKKSEETKVPWWAIMLGNSLFTVVTGIFGIKNRTKYGLSEPGYKHNI